MGWVSIIIETIKEVVIGVHDYRKKLKAEELIVNEVPDDHKKRVNRIRKLYRYRLRKSKTDADGS